MNIDKVIAHYGGTRDLCSVLGVTKAAISQWRYGGMPPLRQYQIEALTHGKFQADRPSRKQVAA